MLLAIRDIVGGLKGLLSRDEPCRERRRHVRLSCRRRIFCQTGRKMIEGSVTGLGLAGLSLELPVGLAQGSTVQISCPDARGDYAHGSVGCRVIWSRRRPHFNLYVAGLRYFDQPEILADSWCSQLLSESGFYERLKEERRQTLRVETLLRGELHLQGGDGLQGQVIDLSPGGARLRALGSDQLRGVGAIQIGPDPKFGPIELYAEIVAVNRDTELGQRLFSLRFARTDAKMVKRLSRLVQSRFLESSWRTG